MRKILLFGMIFCTFAAFAQDVIVKRDGSTILSKVTEVGVNEVKYKKFSNQDGPFYSILKSDIMSINYENGERDTFDEAVLTRTIPTNAEVPDFAINQNLEQDNLQLIKEFNSGNLVYKGTDTKKAPWAFAWVLGLKEGSIIETPELKVNFYMKCWYGHVPLFGNNITAEQLVDLDQPVPWSIYNYSYKIIATLTNKTDKTIYIDLANCFISQNNISKSYFIPTTKSTTSGGTSGGNVNVGAVTGALGVGGTIGTLANGVNVGGSSTNLSTTTTYSQRVVAIPPKMSLTLDPQDIGESVAWISNSKTSAQHIIPKAYLPYFKEKKYAVEKGTPKNPILTLFETEIAKRGDKIDLPPVDGLSPLAAYYTYSFSENFEATQSLHMDFYVKQIMGTRHTNASKGDLDISGCPLLFFTYINF